jgi:hypothetical protein
MDVDLACIGDSDEWLRDLERTIVRAAKHQDAHPVYLLRIVPGSGTMLRLVLLYESHDSERCLCGQDFASYGRLVKCARASAGQRSGTSGPNIGKAPLTWAFSKAAVIGLRDHPADQQFLASLANQHRTGKALTILAPTLARAVYDR